MTVSLFVFACKYAKCCSAYGKSKPSCNQERGACCGTKRFLDAKKLQVTRCQSKGEKQ